MTRVIIHPGFHKTGTSSIQHFFRTNRARLVDHVNFPEPKRFQLATQAAQRFCSNEQNLMELIQFQMCFAETIEPILKNKRPILLLSNEGFSGHLPGRQRTTDFSAAPSLAECMDTLLRDEFGVEDITFYYSLREPDAWLESAYWHHVKDSNMQMDWDEFQETYGASKDLDHALDEIKSFVKSPVKSGKLEDYADAKFGPAEPIVELMGLPEDLRENLKPPRRFNERKDPEFLNQLLQINRSNTSVDEKREAKEALEAEYVANAS